MWRSLCLRKRRGIGAGSVQEGSGLHTLAQYHGVLGRSPQRRVGKEKLRHDYNNDDDDYDKTFCGNNWDDLNYYRISFLSVTQLPKRGSNDPMPSSIWGCMGRSQPTSHLCSLKRIFEWASCLSLVDSQMAMTWHFHLQFPVLQAARRVCVCQYLQM